MKTISLQLTTAILAVCLFSGSDWRQFRGNDSRGVSADKNLPITFSDTENVAWKVPLPGRGPSSPIVVAGCVVVTCSDGDRLHVLCFDAATGKLLWQRQLWATGHTAHHPFGAIAAPTPASDGRLVFAFYSTNDLACFDLDGNLQWFRGLAFDYPTARNDVGMGSSPLVTDKAVVVQIENQGESFAAGIDKATGETLWRVQREHDAMWSSPVLLPGKTPDDDAVLLQGRSRLTAYHASTGKLLWQYETACHSTASATTCDGVVYLPANGLNALQADRATGNVKLLWRENRLRSGSASPTVHDGRVYTVKSPAILACGDARTGNVLWQLRLKGTMWASPVLAGGRLYCVTHEGLVQVIEPNKVDPNKPADTEISTTQIDPAILASPAVADGAIYFRSDRHLWKVALPEQP